jgi:glycosyltransferase involved in cell wall biosynthesis
MRRSVFDSLLKLIGRKKQPGVGWLLLGDINTGSSRIHGINIHNYLLRQGIKSVIYQTSPTMNSALVLTDKEQSKVISSGADILIFQKVFDDKAIAFAQKARQAGKKTIFLLSDKHETEMINAVDQLVVTSDFLKEYFDSNFGTDAVVIEDAIEVDTSVVKQHGDKERLELVWVGHGDHWKTLDIIHEAMKGFDDPPFILKTISNHPDADIPWNLTTVAKDILAGDIAVIPTLNNDWGKGKSNNRLTMFMALGLPVIASPIPTYAKIVNNGKNGFLAATKEEWMQCLILLKDATLRQKIGTQAKSDVVKAYSIETIGEQWFALLRGLVESSEKDLARPVAQARISKT